MTVNRIPSNGDENIEHASEASNLNLLFLKV
jgi:hypothetical protein